MSGDPYIKENEEYSREIEALVSHKHKLEAEIARLQQHRELDRIDRERLQKCLSDRIARLQSQWTAMKDEVNLCHRWIDRLQSALEEMSTYPVAGDAMVMLDIARKALAKEGK